VPVEQLAQELLDLELRRRVERLVVDQVLQVLDPLPAACPREEGAAAVAEARSVVVAGDRALRALDPVAARFAGDDDLRAAVVAARALDPRILHERVENVAAPADRRA